ncbi:MAG: hypothetical protein R3D44_02725 [Hyphomicrobiaceae bacterium]
MAGYTLFAKHFAIGALAAAASFGLAGSSQAAAVRLAQAPVAQPPHAQLSQQPRKRHMTKEARGQLTAALESLAAANRNIQNAPSEQVPKAVKAALEPLQDLQAALQVVIIPDGLHDRAALRDIDIAREQIQGELPDRMLIVDTLDEVIGDVRLIQKEVADAGSLSGTSSPVSGKEQRKTR